MNDIAIYAPLVLYNGAAVTIVSDCGLLFLFLGDLNRADTNTDHCRLRLIDDLLMCDS